MPDYVTNVERKRRHADLVRDIRHEQRALSRTLESIEIQKGRRSRTSDASILGDIKAKLYQLEHSASDQKARLEALESEAKKLEKIAIEEAWK